MTNSSQFCSMIIEPRASLDNRQPILGIDAEPSASEPQTKANFKHDFPKKCVHATKIFTKNSTILVNKTKNNKRFSGLTR